MNKWYTVNDIATMTRLSTRTIRRYLSDGILNGQKIGRQWRFTQIDLENFLDNQNLIDDLDREEQKLKQDFQTGKILVEPTKPQADLTIIHAFEDSTALYHYRDALLERFNQDFQNRNLSLSLRMLANQQLRIVLFGSLNVIQEFITLDKK